MVEEGYDFTDEIKPLVYSLKLQANEIDITLHGYITDIYNTNKKFLRITNKPTWFYYVFCEFANNYSLINDHIDATKFMEAIDNFYNREIELEQLEEYISEQKQKYNELVDIRTIELKDLNEQINETQNKLDSFKSYEAKVTEGFLKDLSKEKLKKALEKIAELELGNQFLTKKGFSLENELKQSNKKNETAQHQILLFRTLIEKIKEKYPNELKETINEISVVNDKETHIIPQKEIREKEA